jgi:outer membrane protein TolC
MAEENANIGVAIAAYYPEISLTAAFGFAGDPLSKVFSAADRVWSLGASASETVFQGGARTAAVQAARAAYDESVASYRQTVLTAFQQVEDELSTLRILQQEAEAAAASVVANQRATDVALNEYRAGTVAYTTVITEQTALLSAQETALTTQQNRFVAAVTLIEALGGGWTMGDLASGG